MGGISSYMSVTWPSPVGIGLRDQGLQNWTGCTWNIKKLVGMNSRFALIHKKAQEQKFLKITETETKQKALLPENPTVLVKENWWKFLWYIEKFTYFWSKKALLIFLWCLDKLIPLFMAGIRKCFHYFLEKSLENVLLFSTLFHPFKWWYINCLAAFKRWLSWSI